MSNAVKKFIGYTILASLFLALFIFICVSDGILVAIGIFASVAAVVGLVSLAVHLIDK